ncbi:hypothetical protein AVEN_190745-1, partial [Araneus ventricosus]
NKHFPVGVNSLVSVMSLRLVFGLVHLSLKVLEQVQDHTFVEYVKSLQESHLSYRSDEPPLLPGEKFHSRARDVTYLCPFTGPVRGTLFVTSYKLYFRSTDKVNNILCV